MNFQHFNDILNDIPPWSVCCTKDVICHAYDTWKLLQSFSFLSHERKLTFSHVICRTMGSCPFWIRKLSFYVSQKYLVKPKYINKNWQPHAGSDIPASVNDGNIFVTKNCARHFWFYNFFYLATARDSVCILRLLP